MTRVGDEAHRTKRDDSRAERDRMRSALLDSLEAEGYIKSPRLRKAMDEVPREDFIDPSLRQAAYADMPLPIGFGQTVSAPHMVAMMCTLMRLEPGHRVLEVGGGCGYHAAVIAKMVAPGGAVTTIEIVPPLAKMAKANLSRLGLDWVEVVCGDGGVGHPLGAPYDRISVAAAAPGIPDPLVEELAEDGVMVIPTGGIAVQELAVVRKNGGKADVSFEGGVVFVPLTGRHGQA